MQAVNANRRSGSKLVLLSVHATDKSRKWGCNAQVRKLNVDEFTEVLGYLPLRDALAWRVHQRRGQRTHINGPKTSGVLRATRRR